jgi:hypothetical protein
MKRYLIFLLAFLSLSAKAQQPIFQERVYMLSSVPALFTASTITKQGNILLSGPGPVGNNKRKFIYMLIDQNLDTIWTQKGMEVNSRVEHGIRQTPDNGFIFAGTVRGISNQPAMALQKLTSYGMVQWTRTYPAIPSLIGNVLPMANGDYLIGGQYGLNKQFSFLCTDNQGNIRWQKDYSWSGNEGFARLALTHSGNVVAIGYTQHPVPVSHIKAMEVNQNGDSLKGKQIIVNGANRAELSGFGIGAILSHSDGGYIITAGVDTVIANNTQTMGMVVKTDSNFIPVWKHVHRNMPYTGKLFIKSIELADSSVIVLAYDVVTPSNQFYLYRFSASGQIMSIYTFPSYVGTLLERIDTFDGMPDNSLIIGGMSSNNITGNFGYYVAKVKIPGLPNVVPPVIPSTVSGISEQSDLNVYLGQSYPNPTATTAIIPYTLPVTYDQAQIILRDITGRAVGNYALQKNSSSLEVNINNLHNGLYTYTLQVDGKPIATKKLAVMQ